MKYIISLLLSLALPLSLAKADTDTVWQGHEFDRAARVWMTKQHDDCFVTNVEVSLYEQTELGNDKGQPFLYVFKEVADECHLDSEFYYGYKTLTPEDFQFAESLKGAVVHTEVPGFFWMNSMEIPGSIFVEVEIEALSGKPQRIMRNEPSVNSQS